MAWAAEAYVACQPGRLRAPGASARLRGTAGRRQQPAGARPLPQVPATPQPRPPLPASRRPRQPATLRPPGRASFRVPPEGRRGGGRHELRVGRLQQQPVG